LKVSEVGEWGEREGGKEGGREEYSLVGQTLESLSRETKGGGREILGSC